MDCSGPLHAAGVEPGAGLCPVCGRPRCRAKAKGSGERCRRSPVLATPTCSVHGSGNRVTRSASERRQAEAKALQAIQGLLYNADAAPVTSPLEELARLAGVLRDAADLAGEQTNELAALTRTTGHGEQLRANVILWKELLALLRATLVDMSKLNIEERQAGITQRHGDLIVNGLNWVFGQLGLGNDPRVRGLLLEMFTAIAEERQPRVPELERARARAKVTVVRGD